MEPGATSSHDDALGCTQLMQVAGRLCSVRQAAGHVRPRRPSSSLQPTPLSREHAASTLRHHGLEPDATTVRPCCSATTGKPRRPSSCRLTSEPHRPPTSRQPCSAILHYPSEGHGLVVPSGEADLAIIFADVIAMSFDHLAVPILVSGHRAVKLLCRGVVAPPTLADSVWLCPAC